MSKLISKVTPLFNRVLVKRFAAESVTSGGVILPTSAQTKLNQGEIIATALADPERKKDTTPTTLMAVGDTVLLPEYGGLQVKLGDKDTEENSYLLFHESDILAVVKK